jgi:hypothetical protein|nr:MAG TPA: DNA REPAIR PROTEIN RAD52 HOMOLOG-BINDING PROTEIN, DNA REPAIR, DNA.7A [Caudoviricetes sp.]
MGNMDIYNAVSTVPGSAQKRITGGRLNGMTDINPMWRIRELTELFGPCGIGWKYKIVREWLETASTGEVGAFVDIELQYKITLDADWSEPIPGTGGSKFVAAEKGNNLRASDECYKMALTDAISVACKALGFGADVYWEAGRTKYNATPPEQDEEYTCAQCGKTIRDGKKKDGSAWKAGDIALYAQKRYDRQLCFECLGKEIKAEKAAEKAGGLNGTI